ncbi:MAG: hypothetical protein RIR00_2644 [Pseudomonadota bacterium]|jgi:protein SCO1/2
MTPTALPRRRLLGAALAAALLAACDTPPAPPLAQYNATVISDPAFGRDFRLKDPQGRERSLADWRGKVVLVFFGYTQCPDACPTALSRAAAVMKLLGADADKVQVLFVSLDPERDTPALLSEYVPSFDPRFLGLYTTPEATPGVAADFKVFYRRNPGATPSTYTIDHSVTTYTYNRRGQLRLLIGHDSLPEQVAADLRQLLQE